MDPLDPAGAFDSAFNERLADVPPWANWIVTGKPSKAYPNGEDEAWWREHGPQMVQRWAEWRAATPWTIWRTPDGQWGIELPFETRIGGELFKGFIDRVFATGDDNTRPLVLDIKSGGMPPRSLFQLGVYKAAIETLWPEVRVAGGTYWMARKGEDAGILNLDKFTPKLLAAYAKRVRIGRSGGVFLPRVSNDCKSCKVGRFCAANNGADSHLDPDYSLMKG